MKKINKVVIPAAGLGTRFLPASKVVPKELFTIVDQPILQINIDEAKEAGITEVILVVSPRKSSLADYFSDDPELESYLEERGQQDLLDKVKAITSQIRVTIVIQEEPKGLGHAILMAKAAVGDEPFAVMLPDDLVLHPVACLRQMMSVWQEHQLGCAAVRAVPEDRIHRYGVIKVERSHERIHYVNHLVEKPSAVEAPSNLAIVGRYLLPPQTFAILEQLNPGAIGEIQLTDALQGLAASEGFLAYEFEGDHFDAGDRLGFTVANVSYGLAHPEIGDELRQVLKELI